MKKVSMIRKYHNHILQTNQQHREEEPHDTKSHKRAMSITQVLLGQGTRSFQHEGAIMLNISIVRPFVNHFIRFLYFR